MEDNVKVSIIIPVYNVQAYLKKCLESLLNQTISNFEVICIDDGSTDNSPAILHQFENRDSRIIIKRQANQGAGAARNLGLRFAKGEYILFLDADDFFELEMIKTLVDTIEADGSDIAVCKARKYDNQTGEFIPMPFSIRKEYCPPISPFSPHDFPKFIFNMFQIAPWNKLFRRDFIQKNHILFQEIIRANDVAFVIQALSLAKTISVVKKELVNYRINTGTSLQQTNDKTPLSFWGAFTEAQNRLVLKGNYEEYKQSFLNCALYNIFYNFRSVKTPEAHNAILALIEQQGEDVFGFFNETINYYYYPDLILEYCLINADLPIALERLKEYRLTVHKKIQEQSKKIQEQSKKIQEQNKETRSLQNELKKIKGSKAFLIGETLAWPIRKTKKLLKQI